MDTATPELDPLPLHDALPISPEQGRNALYELSHQVLQMQDLANPGRGLKLNWTVASAGSATNSTSTPGLGSRGPDRKSTRLNSSHLGISYAVFCLKQKKRQKI